MRYTIIILAAWFCVFQTAVALEKSPPKKESVTFDEKRLYLAVEGDNPGETVKEYLPEGQKLDSWEQLASIREYAQLDDPKAVAENLVRLLKQQNPSAPHQLVQKQDTREVMVDFVTWPADVSFVEFNVFKYSKKKDGGLIAQQYALRNYSDPQKFLRELKPVRERLVKLMGDEGLRQNK
jgi:hypothetical protein